MNVRKPIDYSAMYGALDKLMTAGLPQMRLYYEIGRLVCSRSEKGAAVAAAEYLCSSYPDASGFSPRNLRRMREFYRVCKAAPELLAGDMTIGWTRNIVIFEAKLTFQEKAWYIQALRMFNWSKQELLENISASAHLKIMLDTTDKVCNTGEKAVNAEHKSNGKNTALVPKQCLQVSNDLIHYDRSGKKSVAGKSVPDQAYCHQYRGNQLSGLSSGPPQVDRTWYQLSRQNGLPRCRSS